MTFGSEKSYLIAVKPEIRLNSQLIDVDAFVVAIRAKKPFCVGESPLIANVGNSSKPRSLLSSDNSPMYLSPTAALGVVSQPRLKY